MAKREPGSRNPAIGTGLSGLIAYLRDCCKSFSHNGLVVALALVWAVLSFASSVLPYVDLPHWATINVRWLKVSPLTALLVIVTLCVIVISHGGHRLYRETVLAHDSETADLVRQRETEAGARDWKDLSDRFKGVKTGVRADWVRNTDGSERWSIVCDTTKECEVLCRFAGSMLARSPKLREALPAEIVSDADPLVRWFRFLQTTNAGRIGHREYGVLGNADGEERGVVLMGSIDNLVMASSIACIECAAREV